MVIIFGQSSLSLSLNMSLAKYVPRVHIFVDAAQFSIDLSNSRDTTIYRSNGQHAHIVILNNIFNMVGWFFFLANYIKNLSVLVQWQMRKWILQCKRFEDEKLTSEVNRTDGRSIWPCRCFLCWQERISWSKGNQIVSLFFFLQIYVIRLKLPFIWRNYKKFCSSPYNYAIRNIIFFILIYWCDWCVFLF